MSNNSNFKHIKTRKNKLTNISYMLNNKGIDSKYLSHELSVLFIEHNVDQYITMGCKYIYQCFKWAKNARIIDNKEKTTYK